MDEYTPIEEGDTYLFLVVTYPSGYPSFVNATQGVYSLTQAQNNETTSIKLNDVLNFFHDRWCFMIIQYLIDYPRWLYKILMDLYHYD